MEEKSKGVYSFEWNGKNNDGSDVDDGLYQITADYYDNEGNAQHSAVGSYPIQSVRFDNGKSLLKLGSQYIPLDQVAEIY